MVRPAREPWLAGKNETTYAPTQSVKDYSQPLYCKMATPFNFITYSDSMLEGSYLL